MKQSETKSAMRVGKLDAATFALLLNRPMTNKEFASTRIVATKGAEKQTATGCFELLEKINMAHDGWCVSYETLGLSASVDLSSVWAVVYKDGAKVNKAVVSAEWSGKTKTGLDTVL